MRKLRLIFPLAAIIFGVFGAFSQTWTQTSAPGSNWWSIACSADGTKLAAINYIFPNPFSSAGSPVFLSTDSARTWTPLDNGKINCLFQPSTVEWALITSSADGNMLAAAAINGPFFSSSDAGINWAFTGPFLPPSAEGWSELNSSADGRKLAVVNGAGVNISEDSGNTWTSFTIPMTNGYPTCIAASADCTKLVAGTFFNSIYTSTNSGVTWTTAGPATTGPSFELLWGAVASSADGGKLVAATLASSTIYTNGGYVNVGGPIFVTTNSGTTWVLTTAPLLCWQAVTTSADGNTIIAAAANGPIYISTDSGTTWNTTDAPNTNWQAVACSADGSKLFAAAKGGGIWTSQTVPSPVLNIVCHNGLQLSWLVPSTSLVLQQNSDLGTTNWLTMTNTPVLNLTNLQNQVTLPVPAGNVFFRLTTP